MRSTHFSQRNRLYLLATFALFGLGGCEDPRNADVSAIKQSYSEFRTALKNRDYAKATNYVASDLLQLSGPGVVTNYFRTLTEPDMDPRSDCWVRFDRGNKLKALLFPHRAPTVGYGFVNETNGWKITAHVLPIMD